jgi:protein-ribulosamine 3-kinase
MNSILSAAVSHLLGLSEQPLGFSPVLGGDINQTFKVQVGADVFFAKVNSASRFPRMFVAEAEGLKLLGLSNVRIPEVLGVYETEGKSVLLLEWIESGLKTNAFWESFGKRLAAMHRISSKDFGLINDNYIGSLPQRNHVRNNWNQFFIAQRIEPQFKLAFDTGLMARKDQKLLEQLFKNLDDYFENELPALLHGDLWSGNLMCSQTSEPVFIDPAVYFGHRLMDLGMTRLFGGFDPLFYEAYHNEYPLQQNWEEVTEIANLYPLLVHVNLFGSSYVSQVRSVISRYS